ncbi:MAG: hypothetical protein IT436_13655 [Phycisphaerales bacterium]|nr:hypothetical protein [Phycisphaerales bacterium]
MEKIRTFTAEEMLGCVRGIGMRGKKFTAALALKVGQGMVWDRGQSAACNMAKKLSQTDNRLYITRKIDGVLYLICAADRATLVPAGRSPRRAVGRPRGR